MEDSGALPIEMDVSNLNTGDVVDIYPKEGEVVDRACDEVIAKFELKTNVLLDEVRAGGRIPLIIGRGITSKARVALGRDASVADTFNLPVAPTNKPKGYSLAG